MAEAGTQTLEQQIAAVMNGAAVHTLPVTAVLESGGCKCNVYQKVGAVCDSHAGLLKNETVPDASSACPICGQDTPHQHSPAEISEHREIEAWAQKSWQEFQSTDELVQQRNLLLSALIGLKPILDTAESNASGNPEWEFVSGRINTARAAMEKAAQA